MHIHALHASEFLSFEDLCWTDIPLGATTVVGPNGAGKSNLLRIPRVVTEACQVPQSLYSVPNLPPFRTMHRVGAERPYVETSVGIEFDQEHEQRLLVDYLIASVVTVLAEDLNRLSQQEHARNPLPDRLERLATALGSAGFVDNLTWLFSGSLFVRLVLTPGGGVDRLVYYRFTLGSANFYWLLSGFPFGPTFTSQLPSQGRLGGNRCDLWQSAVDALPTERREALASFLCGDNAEMGRLEFRLDQLIGTLPADGGLDVRPPSTSSQYKPWAIDRLYAELGVPLSGAFRISPMHVFGHVLRRALTVTTNRRRETETQFESIDALWLKAPDLSTGAGLALQLFRWRNGSPEEQSAFERTRDAFARLTAGFEFSVEAVATESPAPSRGRPQFTAPRTMDAEPAQSVPSALVTLTVMVRDRSRSLVPLAYAGAGFEELLHLSALISTPGSGVVLLDEPGANLHPSTQRALRRELASSQAQVITVTHSPYLVDPSAVNRLWRVYPTPKGSKLATWKGQGEEATPARLTQMLEGRSDAVALLFAQLVVLVDGDEDAAALPIWFEHWAGEDGRSLHDLNVAVFALGGKTAAAKYVELLSSYAVPWLLLSDGDALTPGEAHPLRAVRASGVDPGDLREDKEFGELKRQLRKYRVFVVGDSPECNLTDYIERHLKELVEQMPSDVRGASKPRKARWAAGKVACPPDVLALFEEVQRITVAGGDTDARLVGTP